MRTLAGGSILRTFLGFKAYPQCGVAMGSKKKFLRLFMTIGAITLSMFKSNMFGHSHLFFMILINKKEVLENLH